MSATPIAKKAIEAGHITRTPEVHATWEGFVQTKLDRTNALLEQLDQEALSQLIQPEPQPVSSDNA